MFNTYNFSFAGVSSQFYGLSIYDIDGGKNDAVAFGNKGSIIEHRAVRSVSAVHFGVDYNRNPLEFKIVFGADEPIDRFQMERIAAWLTGYQDYQWLVVDQPDMQHVQYRCLVTALEPITIGWETFAFSATFRCDCPYAYSHPFTETFAVSDGLTYTFLNRGSAREFIYPELQIELESGCDTVSIVNKNDNNRCFCISDIPASVSHISVDNKRGIITDVPHGLNLYDGFNSNFFRLVYGDNELEISCNGTVSMTGRFLHNISA